MTSHDRSNKKERFEYACAILILSFPDQMCGSTSCTFPGTRNTACGVRRIHGAVKRTSPSCIDDTLTTSMRSNPKAETSLEALCDLSSCAAFLASGARECLACSVKTPTVPSSHLSMLTQVVPRNTLGCEFNIFLSLRPGSRLCDTTAVIDAHPDKRDAGR